MWKCLGCGEQLEDQFDACWNCGTSKNGTRDQDSPPDKPIFADAKQLEPYATSKVPLPTPCPKCDGKMQQGFIVDTGDGRSVSLWVEGPPEDSFWLGVKVPADKTVPIGTFRCTSCGFLESYARPEFKSEFKSN